MSKLLGEDTASLQSKMLRKLTLLDVMCPVCRGILIEPVTMPCYHCLCRLCFERTMEESSLSCPMCRKRIGGWFRKNSKTGKLIDSKLWKNIKTQFPHEVGAKLNGEDDGIPEDVIVQFGPQQQLCDVGEIRKEYEEDIKRIQDEERKRQQEEERKSMALITQLQEEELQLRLRLKQAEMDEQLALQLQKEASSQNLGQPGARDGDKENNARVSTAGAMPAPNKGPMDAFLALKKSAGPSKCLSPADLNSKARAPGGEGVGAMQQPSGKAERPRCSSNVSSSSHDSIRQEMHHFKPIRAVPRTPPKRLPDGRVMEPKLIKSIPRNLNETYEKMTVCEKDSGVLVPVVRLAHCVDLSSPSSSSSHSGASLSAFAGFGSGSSCSAKRDRSSSCPSEEPTETGETPAKRPKEDFGGEMGACGQRVHQGQKVIAIVQRDAIAEVGGHARRLDTKPEGCAASAGRSAMNDSDSSDANFDDPDVARIIGVQPEGGASEGALEAALGRLAAATNNNVTKPEAYDTREEQLRIERMIRQERADYELALRLDQQWTSLDRRVDRTKGSSRAYELRNARRAGSGRQSTLEEFSTTPRLKHC